MENCGSTFVMHSERSTYNVTVMMYAAGTVPRLLFRRLTGSKPHLLPGCAAAELLSTSCFVRQSSLFSLLPNRQATRQEPVGLLQMSPAARCPLHIHVRSASFRSRFYLCPAQFVVFFTYILHHFLIVHIVKTNAARTGRSPANVACSTVPAAFIFA